MADSIDGAAPTAPATDDPPGTQRLPAAEATPGAGTGTPTPSPATRDLDRSEIEALLATNQGRRRWPGLLAGLVVGTVGTVAVMAWLDRSDDEVATDREAVVLATAEVERRDLQEEIEWAGTLGYGEPVSRSVGTGTVTAAATAGTTVERGDVVGAVDGEPVVLLYGDTPLWRTLAEGAEGRDVRLLETNLAALGYDPDATVDIDDTFTANTRAMVERWQEDLGREVTGVVATADVVVVEGPSSVVDAAEVGGAGTATLVTLAPRRAVVDEVATVDGVVDTLAPIGTSIEPGVVLYRVDGVPVAVVEPAGDPVAATLLSPTFTALELEEALAGAGYDPEGEMTVDEVVTSATEAAVERWQQAVGLPVTGQADPAYYRAPAPERTVDAHGVTSGAVLTTGGPVLTSSVSRLSVEVTVDVAEADEFAVGRVVSIELADETSVDGEVTEIGAITQAADPQSSPTVTVTIAVIGADGGGLIEGPVTVISVGEEIPGATVVPVRSLLALAEGGFGVEKLVDGQPQLIGIELGTFDAGLVQVVDGELEPGDEVVVPG